MAELLDCTRPDVRGVATPPVIGASNRSSQLQVRGVSGSAVAMLVSLRKTCSVKRKCRPDRGGAAVASRATARAVCKPPAAAAVGRPTLRRQKHMHAAARDRSDHISLHTDTTYAHVFGPADDHAHQSSRNTLLARFEVLEARQSVVGVSEADRRSSIADQIQVEYCPWILCACCGCHRPLVNPPVCARAPPLHSASAPQRNVCSTGEVLPRATPPSARARAPHGRPGAPPRTA